jgi:hypothetical protein
MKINYLLKSMWKSVYWYSRRIFNFLLGKSMILPTKQAGNDILIDEQKVIPVMILIENGFKYFVCVVNNQRIWLYWTAELASWFNNSGIFFEDKIEGTLEGKKKITAEDVENIPEKYFQKTKTNLTTKPNLA